MTAPSALSGAIHGWKKTKHPRFAAIAELATKRELPEARPLVGDGGKAVDVKAWVDLYDKKDPLDVPRLVAAVGGGRSSVAAERVQLLAKLKDPRVVSGLLALLEAPPYRAQTALPFFRACAAALVDSEDPRVRPALEALAARYKSILETSVGDLVANILHRAAMSMEEVEPGPLSDEFEGLATNLESMFEAERASSHRTSSAKKSATKNDGALLAAIYESPDDDGPRMVFADALTERGDVRGEFISLQLQRARATVSREQFRRERELSRDPKQLVAFGLPVSRGGRVGFERGFPVSLAVDSKTVKHVVGAPALRTLRAFSSLEQLSNKLARELVQHENARGVTSVGNFAQEQLAGLVGELSWKDVALRFVPRADEVARMTQLRRLSLHLGSKPPAVRADLSKLEHLEVTGELPEGALPLATNARSVALAVKPEWPEFASAEVRSLKSLRELSVRFLPNAAALEGLPIERLETRYIADLNLAAILDALPNLRHLTLATDFSSVDMAKSLAAVGPKLKQLETLQFADMHFTRPFWADATLILQMPLSMPEYFTRLAKSLAVLPEGIAPKAVLKHRDHLEPSGRFIDAPKPDELRILQTANPRLPVELDWY